MEAKLELIDDRILVEDIAEDKMVGAIEMPSEAVGRPTRGRVLAVGPGRVAEEGMDTSSPIPTYRYTRAPMPCEVGDIIVFHQFAGLRIEVNREERRILTSKEVVAILREE